MASTMAVFTSSLSTTAFLSVRDRNSHWLFHSTKLVPPPDLEHPKHISNLTAGGILRHLLFQDLRLLFLKVRDKQRQMQLSYADGEIWDRKAEIPRWCLLTQTYINPLSLQTCRIKAVRQEGESSIHTGPFTPSRDKTSGASGLEINSLRKKTPHLTSDKTSLSSLH